MSDSAINLYDVFKKLNGPIAPIGDHGVDANRLENLKSLCALVNLLVSDIDEVASRQDCHMASVKSARDYADTFLGQTLGIPK